MKSTLYLPVAVVLLAAVVTVLVRRQAAMPAATYGTAKLVVPRRTVHEPARALTTEQTTKGSPT